MVKLIISGLRFYFHYNFFLCKRPSFFLILKHFLKLRFFQDSGFFFKLRFFSKLRVFLKNSDVFKPQGFFVSKLRVFFSKLRFFLKTKFFIVLNNAHVIYLLITIAGSKKMNMMALMIKMVFICFMLHVPLDRNC